MAFAIAPIEEPEPGERAYRAYRLTASGGICGVEHIEAGDDDEAKLLAAMIVNKHGVDLWERARYLASFPPLRAALRREEASPEHRVQEGG
ncbi:hypothetical protein [Methylobacterium gnaphalii]|uniref:Uncharacterized protein n=1 Tax=Methylobacterium gnaphalii TaxID=1010610 RepID=A0A512JGV6_9HYPH|nr:hypothetical protein [Methylobacterium gnaphalii]GEP09208.1 hypothetical protein MGN01_10530 [Methylobacterium gnaphalii]GJD67620.1 hypothetical protein MMMDOFMJ_0536 [Methylobacterium gnaphalii]GLS50531.1 hypothetical protein GCM10007885_33830 [Methylobacterium gnaphalii]